MQATLAMTDLTELRRLAAAGIRNPNRAKILCIMNGKGGVGKSSLSSNVAYTLADQFRYRVALVEMDPQGNTGEDLGFKRLNLYDGGQSQADAVMSCVPIQPVGEARPGLAVVPGGNALEDLIEELYVQRRLERYTNDQAWMYMYAAALSRLTYDYDIIVLDVAPGSMVLQVQALIAADMVLVPCRTDASSRKGLSMVAQRFSQVLNHNPGLQLLGIILFATGTGSHAVQRDIRQLLERDVRGAAPIFDKTIRNVEKIASTCRKNGLLPAELATVPSLSRSARDSATHLAADYRELTREILTEIAKRKNPDYVRELEDQATS